MCIIPPFKDCRSFGHIWLQKGLLERALCHAWSPIFFSHFTDTSPQCFHHHLKNICIRKHHICDQMYAAVHVTHTNVKYPKINRKSFSFRYLARFLILKFAYFPLPSLITLCISCLSLPLPFVVSSLMVVCFSNLFCSCPAQCMPWFVSHGLTAIKLSLSSFLFLWFLHLGANSASYIS